MFFIALCNIPCRRGEVQIWVQLHLLGRDSPLNKKVTFTRLSGSAQYCTAPESSGTQAASSRPVPTQRCSILAFVARRRAMLLDGYLLVLGGGVSEFWQRGLTEDLTKLERTEGWSAPARDNC